jgi:hypothetical protein
MLSAHEQCKHYNTTMHHTAEAQCYCNTRFTSVKTICVIESHCVSSVVDVCYVGLYELAGDAQHT